MTHTLRSPRFVPASLAASCVKPDEPLPQKSLDGYYQESGRAGRDGKDADCILYYRPQDAARLSALICGEVEGQQKRKSSRIPMVLCSWL
jgi:hypothetical protein